MTPCRTAQIITTPAQQLYVSTVEAVVPQYIPSVTSNVTFMKYAVHGLLPDSGWETRADKPTFRIWTKIWPNTCFDTSNDLR